MKTKVVIAILAVAVLSGAVYWCVMWNLGRSFQKADWQGLQSLVEASAGQVVTEPVTRKEPSQRGPGAIPYYQEHPEELQRDKRSFETWRSAFLIASYLQDHQQSVEEWTSSTKLQWVPPSDRTDPWGHGFCVRSNPQRIVVVSPGPQAIGSIDCGTLDIPEQDLAKMTSGRLNVQASGALVLVLAAQRHTGD